MERILLLNQNHIGDALFGTPAIAALRAALPDATIISALRDGVRPLFACDPHLTDVWGRRPSSALLEVAFLRRVRRARFDTVICFSASSTKQGIVARLSGAPRRVGFDHPGIRRFLTVAVPVRSGEQHHVDDRLDLVRSLVPVPQPYPLGLTICPEWEQELQTLEPGFGSGERPVVGLNAGSTVAAKQWPVDRWAALAELLSGAGMQPVLFGGPGDAPLVQAIVGRLPAPIASLQGRLSLGASAAAIRRCAAFVSGDTGPLHMAVAVGTPVVAIYGPTNPRRTGPYTTSAVVLHRPSEPGAPGGTSLIGAEEVAEAVMGLTEREKPTPEAAALASEQTSV
jgi:ADP-heptose:LPS heptosyltransferase